MCGIAGIWSRDGFGTDGKEAIAKMTGCLKRRGPDADAIVESHNALLGHARLSIIDVSELSNQPMQDPSHRYTLVFNGEIYNFLELRAALETIYNIGFTTAGDTEVLLHGLICEGEAFLQKVNGFFAFGFYDRQEDTLLVARDRYGIKPLYYAFSEGRFAFASSLTALMHDVGDKALDHHSLFSYFQFSYIPAPDTIFAKAKKLMPANMLRISQGKLNTSSYYELPTGPGNNSDIGPEYADAIFKNLLGKSVERRLVADVPVGTFLSGGFDSSVVSLLANQLKPGMPAFTIGFPDQPYFDESSRAAKIAKHLGMEHHIINLRENDIDGKLMDVLTAIDEPFADSSAVLVNILSEYARENVKVALSGDGADEIMGGYNKHRALLRSGEKSLSNIMISAAAFALRRIPDSRNSKLLNQLRQVKRYGAGVGLSLDERYELWASWTQPKDVAELLLNPQSPKSLSFELDPKDFNSILAADMKLVLPNDMLHKVDLMSMDKSLEVRVPFLDHELVDFLFGLSANYKVRPHAGKRILRKAFAKDFPDGFFDKRKKGFEAPLTHWMTGPLQPLRRLYLNKKFIEDQGLFNFETVRRLEQKALSKYSGDAPHTLWALLVFQSWFVREIAGNGIV